MKTFQKSYIIYIERKKGKREVSSRNLNLTGAAALRGRKETLMTKREVMDAIIEANVNAEVTEWAEAELERMDRANKRNAEKRAEKAKENEPIKAAIFEVLGDEPKTATEIKDEIGIDGVSVQKVSALMKKIVEAGEADKVDVKVKGKGTQKGYTRA